MLNISIPLTEQQERKLERWITKYNKQRARNNQPPYATYQEAIRDFVIKKLKDCARSATQREAREVMRIFVDLDEETQNEIRRIAGL